MKYKRADRVAALLKEEVSILLLQEMKDPGLGFMTVTRVKMSDDLKHGKIFYSVLGDEKARAKAAASLKKAGGYIRGELGHRLKLRIVPEIAFVFDDSIAYADHINTILKNLHQDE